MKAEEYIKVHTQSCNCTLLHGLSPFEWITADDARAAVELARNELEERIIEILNAEKEDTGIGLSEYDAGFENGRMELLECLLNKLQRL